MWLWLPWAVDMLRAEVIELANAMNITAEAIAAGANADTEEGDDDLL